MKTFEELFAELKDKADSATPDSSTVKELAKGKHFIGKKLVEAAAGSSVPAGSEVRDRTAEDLSQLLYHAQVMMIACGLSLEDVYKVL